MVIYCKAISNLKRLPAQSYPLSASSLMSDGIKEQSHHFIFAVDPALWYFQSAYINNPLLSTTTMGKTQFSEKRGVKCPTFWRRIIPEFEVQRLLRRAPVALKFSQVPLGRAEIFASKGAAVPSVKQGAHEVTAASANQRELTVWLDSLHVAFPPKTLRVQLKSINAETSTPWAFQSDRGNGLATTMLAKMWQRD